MGCYDLEECLKIIDLIISDLTIQLQDLRDSVINKNTNYFDDSWERQLRMYNECAIKKYQTEFIKKKILNKLYKDKIKQ